MSEFFYRFAQVTTIGFMLSTWPQIIFINISPVTYLKTTPFFSKFALLFYVFSIISSLCVIFYLPYWTTTINKVPGITGYSCILSLLFAKQFVDFNLRVRENYLRHTTHISTYVLDNLYDNPVFLKSKGFVQPYNFKDIYGVSKSGRPTAKTLIDLRETKNTYINIMELPSDDTTWKAFIRKQVEPMVQGEINTKWTAGVVLDKVPYLFVGFKTADDVVRYRLLI